VPLPGTSTEYFRPLGKLTISVSAGIGGSCGVCAASDVESVKSAMRAAMSFKLNLLGRGTAAEPSPTYS
jgi:hypothetical protein